MASELPVIREEVIVPGLLTKRVVQEGNPEEECPLKGSDVTVHYTGRLLDGTIFDSSHKRNDPFKFKIGQGQVIKGWDEGVITMRPGEKAFLRCEPDYAYGASGSPPTIPPNSTLEFEVDLLSWTNEEVLEDSNGQVTKKLQKEGSGFTNPEDYATVSIKYSATVLPKGPELHPLSQEEESYLIGEDPQAVEGFELALKSMKQGEKASFTVLPSLAYGAQGNAALNVPANAKIRYEIELLSFANPKDTYSMSFEERLAYLTKLKELGNKFFKAGKVAKAEGKYGDAVRLFEYEKDLSEEQLKQVNQVRVVALQNQAICLFKQNKFGACLEKSEQALSFDPKNVKCLFKKGQCHFALEQLPEAERDLSAALSLDKDNKEILRELNVVKRKIKAEKEAEKKRFGGFFNKISLFSEEETKPEQKKEEDGSVSSDEEEFSADAKPSPLPEEPVANPPAAVEAGEQEQ